MSMTRRLMASGPAVRVFRFVIGLLVIGLLVLEATLLAGHLDKLGGALAHANLELVALALALEAVSWLAFAALHRRMLAGGGLRVPLPHITGVLLASNAISATLPAGSALATGYTFTRFRRCGATVPLAAWAIVMVGLISSATLGGLGLAAALLVGSNKTSSVAAVTAVAITLALAGGLRMANHHPDQLAGFARMCVRGVNRVRRRAPTHEFDRVGAFVAQLGIIRPRGRDWLAGVGFATVNWATDVACLVLAARAVGITDVAPRVIVIAYAADAVVGAVQLVPGGIGLVEGALVVAFVGGGVPFAAATAAVVIYRLISFVLVTVVGWMSWLGLRDQRRARDVSSAEATQIPTLIP